MSIKKTSGTIVNITDLSPTAKVVEIRPDVELGFVAGSFVNIFMDIGGVKVRRAYSISSSDSVQDTFTITVRLSPEGAMTPLFWKTDMKGKVLELMGPLGINTADKMKQDKIYLFAFGIGAGVVKSLAEHLSKRHNLRQLTIMTGSRTEDEIIHKDFFDMLAERDPRVKVTYVISQPSAHSSFKKGYVHEHFEGLDFNHADIYSCGQESACNDLIAKIQKNRPVGAAFFTEGFH